MPAIEAILPRFHAADTQVLGVSIDSVHSHANWGRELGGVSFPLLSDFEPKGAMAKKYDAYLEGPGITDRATVIVDKEGVVRYSESVTPSGRRNVEDLLAKCEEINGGSGKGSEPRQLGRDSRLFVKSSCGFSRRVLVALDNLHLRAMLKVENVSDQPAAREELTKLGGKDQAPCFVMNGKAMFEADEITRALADEVAPLT